MTYRYQIILKDDHRHFIMTYPYRLILIGNHRHFEYHTALLNLITPVAHLSFIPFISNCINPLQAFLSNSLLSHSVLKRTVNCVHRR